VVSRNEEDPSQSKEIRIVAHPDTPINFETSERVTVNVQGSRGADVMIGPKYGGAVFHGGAGDDMLIAKSGRGKDIHLFYGGSGNDTLIGGNSRDVLDGGTGNDVIRGGTGSSKIYGGPGNDDISDGTGGSEIHTGPGRNIVRSDGGDDHIYIGSGHNTLAPGPGKAVFHVDYGGITVFENWEDSYTLDLTKWPKSAHISEGGAGYTDVTLGVAVVRIHARLNEKKLRRQIKQ